MASKVATERRRVASRFERGSPDAGQAVPRPELSGVGSWAQSALHASIGAEGMGDRGS